MKEKIGTS